MRSITPLLVPADYADGFIGAYWRRPEAYLDLRLQAGMPTLALLALELCACGIARLAHDLATGAWDARYGYLRKLDAYDVGYRLVVAEDRPVPACSGEQHAREGRMEALVRILVRIARVLLGLIFVLFGPNGLYVFIPVPEYHPFMSILVSSGYIYLIKIVEITGGLLLLLNRFVPLALIILGPGIVNILAYHVLLDRRNWPIAVVNVALFSILL